MDPGGFMAGVFHLLFVLMCVTSHVSNVLPARGQPSTAPYGGNTPKNGSSVIS